MSIAVYDELIRFALLQDTDPHIVERQKILTKIVLEVVVPQLQEEGWNDVRKEGRERGYQEGRILGARSILRRLIARRKLTLAPEQEARIDACSDLETLERWHVQAIDAQNTENALE